MQPPGEIGILGMRADAIFEQARNGGKWMGCWANSAKRDPATNVPIKIRIYLDRDKVPRQSKFEACGRKLLETLNQSYPAHRGALSFDKREAKVFISGEPLAKVQVLSRTSVQVQWIHAVVEKYSIDREAISRLFLTRAEDKLVWTI